MKNFFERQTIFKSHSDSLIKEYIKATNITAENFLGNSLSIKNKLIVGEKDYNDVMMQLSDDGNAPYFRIENNSTAIGNEYGILWGGNLSGTPSRLKLCSIHAVSEEVFNIDIVYTGWSGNANTEYMRYDASANELVTPKEVKISSMSNAGVVKNSATGLLSGGNILALTDITPRSHTSLSDVGTNTHAQIDTHISTYSFTAISVMQTIYPVGAIYISTLSTNPNTLLGFGTWAAFGAGKVLVSLDSADADFDTAEETGGAKTKTIATANLPNISTGAGTSHNHAFTGSAVTSGAGSAHTHTQNAHSHYAGNSYGFTVGGGTTLRTTEIGNQFVSSETASNQNESAHTHSVTAAGTNAAEASHTHSLGGSGTALNVMNPYIVVYMWKRTA